MYSTILEKLVKVFADFILPYLYDDGFYATQREAGKKGEKKEGEIPPFGHPFSWLQQTDFFIPSSLEISDHTLRASRRVPGFVNPLFGHPTADRREGLFTPILISRSVNHVYARKPRLKNISTT